MFFTPGIRLELFKLSSTDLGVPESVSQGTWTPQAWCAPHPARGAAPVRGDDWPGQGLGVYLAPDRQFRMGQGHFSTGSCSSEEVRSHFSIGRALL